MTLDTFTSRELFDIAFAALQDLFHRSGPPPSLQKAVDIPYEGTFVTLRVDEELRGCIGYLANLKPLGDAVYELAQKSATTDRRFKPLRESELDSVSIEITILEPMEEISAPEEITIGTHGVFIEQGVRRGILLPQVAGERGWSAERFLDAVCEKALLPTGAWQSPGTTLKRFAATILTSDNISH